MRVGLLREIADFGRRDGLLTVIDNTFATPVNFRPLQPGSTRASTARPSTWTGTPTWWPGP